MPLSVELLVGSDFGVPSRAGDQAKKIILIEAVRTGSKSYEIRPTGRNERLVRSFSKNDHWHLNRRGWTLPGLASSLGGDKDVSVASFDFPFSIPLQLLDEPEFAAALNQPTFRSRAKWAEFVSENLSLEFDSDRASGSMNGLSLFENWRDKRFWLKRETDKATGGSPPLKHKFQNLFSMTIAGAALLRSMIDDGFFESLDSAGMLPSRRTVFETYPGRIARHIGFEGSYKKRPSYCLTRAEEYLRESGVHLSFDDEVRRFCVEYRTSGDDPDGADAFLCLVASISFREGFAELCNGMASSQVLHEEGCIIAPRRMTPPLGTV